MGPAEVGPSTWLFPPAETADEHGVVAIGGDLAPGTVIDAYRRGLFPMHLDRGSALAWWSPDPRGIIPLDELRVSRSLRRSCQRYAISIDRDFEGVIDGCADPGRPHGWINADIRDAYTELHRLGWVHSVEVWDGAALVGGLYGVAINGLFAGESMFHRATDASKVALVALVDAMRDAGGARLLDVQWATEHLHRLGAVEMERADYLERLAVALEEPALPIFS